MARFRELLANKNFVLLWLGQVVSNFGDRLNQMALVALVYQKHPGSEIALAKLISFTIIPVFVIGPLAGVWVDRLNRRHVMIISDILRGTLVFLIPLFIILNQMLIVYFIIFLTFSISRFFIPSKMALIPEIVTKDKLLAANSLHDTTHMIGNVVGLVVAGIIVNIRYIGAIGGFYIDSASFFISAAFIAMMVQSRFVKDIDKDLKTTKEALGNSIRRSIFADISEGLGYLINYSNMRFVVLVFLVLMAGLGTISCVIIVFVQQAFGTATRDLGFLGMFLVVGLFLGTLLYGKFGQRAEKKLAIMASFFASGVSIILFTVAVSRFPNLLLGGMFAALLGISASPMMASVNTLTHETIPQEVRGRIFSSLEAVIHLAFIVFMFIAAAAANYVDRFWILIAVGVIFSIAGLAGTLRKLAFRPF
jgi:MFS transporter, DHA3 family, macrolide efflux protein